MDIGIIGSGRVGRALARVWLSKGHRVMLSYARQVETLERLAEQLGVGASVGTPTQAARFSSDVSQWRAVAEWTGGWIASGTRYSYSTTIPVNITLFKANRSPTWIR